MMILCEGLAPPLLLLTFDLLCSLLCSFVSLYSSTNNGVHCRQLALQPPLQGAFMHLVLSLVVGSLLV